MKRTVTGEGEGAPSFKWGRGMEANPAWGVGRETQFSRPREDPAPAAVGIRFQESQYLEGQRRNQTSSWFRHKSSPIASALALAQIRRLGQASPVSLVDSYVMRDIAGFLETPEQRKRKMYEDAFHQAQEDVRRSIDRETGKIMDTIYLRSLGRELEKIHDGVDRDRERWIPDSWVIEQPFYGLEYAMERTIRAIRKIHNGRDEAWIWNMAEKGMKVLLETPDHVLQAHLNEWVKQTELI